MNIPLKIQEKLEKLEDALLEGKISETTYLELKKSLESRIVTTSTIKENFIPREEVQENSSQCSGCHKALENQQNQMCKECFRFFCTDCIEKDICLPCSMKSHQKNQLIAQIKQKMVFIQGEEFPLGIHLPTKEDQRKVTVNDFLISQFPVTYEEFDLFCTENDLSLPAYEKEVHSGLPIVNITWFEAVQFCNWLSEVSNLTPCYELSKKEWICHFKSNGYRLPTETEWEFACIGGIKRKDWVPRYAGSNFMDQIGWCFENSKEQLHIPGQKKPNEIGLFDMSGNVREWCWDWYNESYRNLTTLNPTGSSTGHQKSVRGGSFQRKSRQCGSCFRDCVGPKLRLCDLGFRLSQSAVQ